MGEEGARWGARTALRDEVVAHLRQGPDSISGIGRALGQTRRRPLHRLHVAGYLAALADLGLLQVVDRPPSKIYRLANADANLSLHQRIGRAVRESEPRPGRHAALAVASLVQALGRPVFHAELVHAGIDSPPEAPGVVPVQADERERRAYRNLLQRRPVPRIDLGRGDTLLSAPGLEVAARAVLLRVLREATDSGHLAARDGARQVPLGADEAPA